MKDDFAFETAYAEALHKLLTVPVDQRNEQIDEFERRAELAYAKATFRNYKQMQALFAAWCGNSGYSSSPPVEPTVVARYIDFLSKTLSVGTIMQRLWSINMSHRARFLPQPGHDPLVGMALRSAKRQRSAQQRQANPLCKEEVLAAIQRLGSSRRDLRDKIALWIASDSWCRASEIVGFRVRDLQRQADGTFLLFISRSKTDPFGRGDYAYISKAGAAAILEWIAHAGLTLGDPILTKSQTGGKRQPLSTRTLSCIIKRAVGRSDVSAHSTRVGGVHDALRLGCSMAEVMAAGRWGSPNMPAHYGRRISAGHSAAALVCRANGLT